MSVLNVLAAPSQTLTLSSLEIAELTGKRHDHVIRDTRNMLNSLEIAAPQIWGTASYEVNGATRTREVANLTKELSITLVSGYNVQMRHAIVKRWLELETEHNPQPVSKMTFAEQMKAALEAAQEVIAKQAEEIEKKTAVIEEQDELISGMRNHFHEGMEARDFVRTLNGVNVMQFANSMIERGLLYRDRDGITLRIVRGSIGGRMFTEQWIQKTTPGHVRNKLCITLTVEGAEKLLTMYRKDKLPMKSNWDHRYGYQRFSAE